MLKFRLSHITPLLYRDKSNVASTCTLHQLTHFYLTFLSGYCRNQSSTLTHHFISFDGQRKKWSKKLQMLTSQLLGFLSLWNAQMIEPITVWTAVSFSVANTRYSFLELSGLGECHEGDDWWGLCHLEMLINCFSQGKHQLAQASFWTHMTGLSAQSHTLQLCHSGSVDDQRPI